MRACESFRGELAVLGTVRGAESLPPALAAHALECAACERHLASRVAIDSALDLLGDEEPPAYLAARARIAAATTAAGAGRPAAVRLAAFAVAAAMLVAVVFGMRERERTRVRTNAQTAVSRSTPDPELLARLDLLLDWQLLDQHAEDLDLLSAAELAAAVALEEDEG